MSDEQIQETVAAEATPSVDVQALKNSIEALERKNYELIGKLKNAKTVPEGVDVDALLEFKRKAEQAELESKGNYDEALQARDKQYRDAVASKDERIAELEQRVRELELITPAVSALADIVHDPDMVLKTKLSSDKIEREPDGSVVVVDGYERKPVAEWAKAALPDWMQKAPRPQGSGAPSSRSGGGELPVGMKNPFARETYNLTEQHRIYKTDRDLFDRLKAAAGR